MRLSILSAVAAVTLLGCGIPAREDIPEDSRRIVCSTGAATVPVTVVDAAGQPVQGVTVKAEHLASGEFVSATTNTQGRVSTVTSELGSGTVRVTADFGGSQVGTADVTWTCGECNCSATPSQISFTAK